MDLRLNTRRNSNQFLHSVSSNKIIHEKKSILKLISICLIFIEIIALSTVFWGLVDYRISMEFDESMSLSEMNSVRLMDYLLFFIITLILYYINLYRYKTNTSKGGTDDVFRIIKAFSISILLTIGVVFLLKIGGYSRFVVLMYFALGLTISLAIKFIKSKIVHSLARKGILNRNVIIIGAGNVGEKLAKELANNKKYGFKVIGFLDDYKSNGEYVNGYKVLGKIDDVKKVISDTNIDEIIITIPSNRKVVNNTIAKLRKHNISIKIIPEMFDLVTSTMEVGNMNSLPFVSLVKTPIRGLNYYVKRTFDIVSTSLLIGIISPVLIITALMIKLDSKGSVIFKQRRVGKDGKLFYMYKFRSMVENADSLKKELIASNEVNGAAFKIIDDPRVTKVGRFIRKYSIDELPQLFNVLIGNMSLIGPRPPLPQEVDVYSDWEWKRLETVPGITGLWQVSGRSDLSFEQWVSLDIYYIENWNMLLDLKILLKTIPVVIKGEGAY